MKNFFDDIDAQREYKALLEKPATTKSEQEVCFKELQDFLTLYFPKRLFRFRRCSERALEEFYRDQLSFGVASKMNDDFDSLVYFDKNTVRNRIEDLLSNAIKMTPERIKKGAKDINEINQGYTGSDNFLKYIDSLPDEVIKANIRRASESLLSFYDEEYNGLPDNFQKCIKFACFSEDITSSLMWGHYSDSSSGFAIEYEFQQSFQKDYGRDNNKFNIKREISCSLYPLLYRNERVDASRYVTSLWLASVLQNIADHCGFASSEALVRAAFPDLDMFMPFKIAINKSDEWKPEHEWRLFCTSYSQAINDEEFTKVRCKPIAVYLGRRISSLNKKIIIDMATEKNIDVYQMMVDEQTSKYRLKCVKI